MTEPQSTASRRLVVVRHAKAEPFASTDHARALTDRGEDDARQLGRWLAEADAVPELVLASTAARARRTAELLIGALPVAPDFRTLDVLYGADPSDVAQVCAALDPGVGVVAVVGHNPTMMQLAAGLVAGEEPLGHFPTCAAAVIELPSGWAEIGAGGGALVELWTPRG